MSTMAAPAPAQPSSPTERMDGHAPPSQPARSAQSAENIRDQRFRLLQLGMFTAGAILMPLGILTILLGWYGMAHTKYEYNQMPYLISGGILGLALTFIGGFLYFGALIAKSSSDQRETARQLADSMLLVAALVRGDQGSGGTATDLDPASAAQLVVAGEGTTLHRRDCPLIASRTDLHEVTTYDPSLTTCRVCRPTEATV